MELDQKVKKDPDGNFLFLPFESPKMPKSIKREVTRREIKKFDSRSTKFSEFQCKICQKYLFNQERLNYHTECHFQPSSFECKKCEKVFKMKQRFETHKCVKKSERHFCTFCEKNYTQAESLTQHIKNFHADKMNVNFFYCDFCDQKFIEKKSLNAHFIKSVCRKIFFCDHCGKKFNNKVKFSRHIQIHAIHKVTCEICHSQVKLIGLRKHKRKVHQKSYHLKCQFCDRKFSCQGYLNEHMKFHENPEQFKCQICGHQATRKDDLKNHLRRHEENREKNLKCDQCDFKTDRNFSLKNHLKFHEKLNEKLKNSPKAIKCEKCPSVLKNELSYKNHIRVKHGNRKKLECNLCEAEFLFSSRLKLHMAQKHSK
jgi:KRAB domain-containing zinc finger protein